MYSTHKFKWNRLSGFDPGWDLGLDHERLFAAELVGGGNNRNAKHERDEACIPHCNPKEEGGPLCFPFLF